MSLITRRSEKLRNLANSAAKLAAKRYNTSVDTEEIQQHNKFAYDWWDASGNMKGLHALNEIRVPFIRTGLINVKQLKEENTNNSKYLQGLKILDVGCGGGILSIPLARLGGNVTGVDPSQELVEVANRHASQNLKPENSAQFICSSIEEHSFKTKEHYDVVVASEVIEHVSKKEMFIQSCVECMKPGGSIFFTTMNRTYITWVTAILIAENILNLLPKGHHHYSKLITPDELRSHLEKLNCKVLQINGFTFNPIRNCWEWVSNNSIGYALHAIKQEGN